MKIAYSKEKRILELKDIKPEHKGICQTDDIQFLLEEQYKNKEQIKKQQEIFFWSVVKNCEQFF